MKITVLPSLYLPWKGYFDLIHRVDECFISENPAGNQTIIKTGDGLHPLTIPVENLQDTSWAAEHWNILEKNYARAPRFRDYAYIFYAIYQNMSEKSLSRINYIFIQTVCDILGIATPVKSVSGDISPVQLYQQAGADHFLADSNAPSDLQELTEAGIRFSLMDYTGYPPYRQLYPPFEHHVSILDLLFTEGSDSPRYLKFV